MKYTAPISCIITSYNNRATLSAAIRSVLSQSLSVGEIIIADDASTDGSRELISELSRQTPKIRPIFQEKNVGIAANRDIAYRAARFDFVTQLDGDDIFGCDKIKAEWNVLAGSESAIAYSLIASTHPGKPWRTRVIDPRETVGGSPDSILEQLLARTGAIPRDMLFSKNLYIQAGGYSHETFLYEDWQLKLRLAIQTGVEWLYSGTVGTIYMQRAGTRSKIGSETLYYWQKRVIEIEKPKIMPVLNKFIMENASFISNSNSSKAVFLYPNAIKKRGYVTSRIIHFIKRIALRKLNKLVLTVRYIRDINKAYARK